MLNAVIPNRETLVSWRRPTGRASARLDAEELHPAVPEPRGSHRAIVPRQCDTVHRGLARENPKEASGLQGKVPFWVYYDNHSTLDRRFLASARQRLARRRGGSTMSTRATRRRASPETIDRRGRTGPFPSATPFSSSLRRLSRTRGAIEGHPAYQRQWFSTMYWSSTGTPAASNLRIAATTPLGVRSRVGSLSRRTIKIPK